MNSASGKDQAAVTRVGVIGLGIMGRPMARNLLQAGFTVVVYSRTAATVESMRQYGARPAVSPADVASQVDLVVTMLPDSPDVEAVAGGAHGIFTSARPGLVIADMSTISAQVTRDLAAEAAKRDCAWLDAPVSGGEAGAVAGTLSIMVGGEATAFERARPVFMAMGSRVIHVGASGHGQLAKLCNQVLGAVNLLSACEALVLAAKAGLDLEKVHEALAGGAANSWAFEHLGRRMLNRDFAPGFKVGLQQKDLRLVSEAARELGVPTVATSLVQQLLRVVENQGKGEAGTQALVTVFEALAGATVRGGHAPAGS